VFGSPETVDGQGSSADGRCRRGGVVAFVAW
jgi:hypothetical protein